MFTVANTVIPGNTPYQDFSVLNQRFLQHRNRLDDPVPVHIPIQLYQHCKPLLKRQYLQHCNRVIFVNTFLNKKNIAKTKQITCYKHNIRVCTVIYLNNTNKELYSKIF